MEKRNWKKFFAKKWVFPALYMIAAALIFTFMWIYQDPNDYPLTKEELGLEEMTPNNAAANAPKEELLAETFEDAVPAVKQVEKMSWPVENPDDIQVIMEFFDENATDEQMQEAIVTFEDQLWPHTGLDMASTNGETFHVAAALSGQVIRAEKDPIVGYVVEMEHENGLVTIYSSLGEIDVTKGQEVKQGEWIGLAGRNVFEKDQGIHLHFEVRKDGKAFNPDLFFDQEVDHVLNQLQEQDVTSTEQE